jgi:hypothetical protein
MTKHKSQEASTNEEPEAAATPSQLAAAMRRVGGLFNLPRNWLIKLRSRNLPKGESLH